ncbi:hypothetical protein C0995_013643 [Termitomyces sp. Mi166|nr:hypothetical protein C0995_013643 [Termitomyces sp. Mi166\
MSNSSSNSSSSRSTLIALEQMKTHMVRHRDVKTVNIVLTPSGHIRMIDFSFATRLKASRVIDVDFQADPNAMSGSFRINDPDYTSTEQVRTPPYMSPDVHLGRFYSFEADLHALGVTLYNMLTGRLPFGEGVQSHDEIFEAALCEQLTFRSSDPVSPEARDLLSCLLRRDSKRPVQLEDILCHPCCWDKVRSQTASCRWKPHFTPFPKDMTVCTVTEGAECFPDSYPDFTYVSPELLSLRSRGKGGIWKKNGAFFTGNYSQTFETPPSASPVWSVPASKIDSEALAPSPPPNILLPPLPTPRTADLSLKIISCSGPTQLHSPDAGSVLPPLSIRQKLAQRAPPPAKLRPIRGHITRMPEVTITPADLEDEVQESESNSSHLRLPFVEVGPMIKLSAPPKRAKRAQKENAGLDVVTNIPSQAPQSQTQIELATVAPKPTLAPKPIVIPKLTLAPEHTLVPTPLISPKPTVA